MMEEFAQSRFPPSQAVPSMPEDHAPRNKQHFISRLSDWEISLILAPFKSGVLLSDSVLVLQDAFTNMKLPMVASKLVSMLERSERVLPGSVELTAPSGRAGGVPFPKTDLINRITKPHLRQMLEPVKRSILSSDSVYSVRDIGSGMDFAVSVDMLLKMTDIGNTASTATGYENASTVKSSRDLIDTERSTERSCLTKRKLMITAACLILLLAAVVSVILIIVLSGSDGSGREFTKTPSTTRSDSTPSTLPSTSATTTTAGVNPHADTRILIIGDQPQIVPSDGMELYYPFNPQLNKVLDAKMIHKRYGHTSVLMDDGTVITVGGKDHVDDDDDFLSSCERFTPSNYTVTKCPSLNTKRMYPASSVLNGITHVCGGYGMFLKVFQSCERLISNAWQNAVSMNTKRWGLSMVSLNGYLYAIGGFDYGSKYFSSVERLSVVDSHWTFVKSMKTGRTGHSAAVMEGKIFVCGGGNDDGTLATCESYSPNANQWSYITQMNRKREGFALATDGFFLFSVGGGNIRLDSGTVEIYHGNNDTWAMMHNELIRRRWKHSAVVIP